MSPLLDIDPNASFISAGSSLCVSLSSRGETSRVRAVRVLGRYLEDISPDKRTITVHDASVSRGMNRVHGDRFILIDRSLSTRPPPIVSPFLTRASSSRAIAYPRLIGRASSFYRAVLMRHAMSMISFNRSRIASREVCPSARAMKCAAYIRVDPPLRLT